MVNPAWFDEYTYLNSKLNQLQLAGETGYTNINQVKSAIETAGWTTFDHFSAFSLSERTNPDIYFNTNEYLAAKAVQLNTTEGVTTWTVDSVALAFQNAGYTNAYDHFAEWGWRENVNPSNAFDVSEYIDLKVAASGLTEDQVEAAFVAHGLDPISHYLTYGINEAGIEVVPVPPDEMAGLTAFNLTTYADTASAEVFNSVPTYTPGGNDFVNTLQDEDHLTGIGENPTLNVTLGYTNDNSNYMVTPILDNIQTVNVQVTGEDIDGINFQNATGLETLNVTRLTANNSEVWFEDLAASTTNIGIANATRDGEMSFEYREDELTASDNELNLTLDSVRLYDLNIREGNDTDEDAGYGFETVNVAVEGTTNIDYFDLDGNYDESVHVAQTLNVTVDAALEINDLDAHDVEFINIEANDTVMIADDEDDVLSQDNDGISTGNLQEMIITGDSMVTIDGLDGAEGGYTFDASALQAAVHLGMEEASDGVVAISGIGDDWIYAYESMGADVTTGAGDDDVRIYSDNENQEDNGDQENTSQIDTGAGDDYVYVQGDMLADTDVSSESNELGDVERASIVTGAGDDIVDVGNLESAKDWDHNVLNDGNVDDLWTMAAASIDTGAGNDEVSAGSMGENAMISTDAGDDMVTIDVNGAIELGEDGYINDFEDGAYSGVVLEADDSDSREVTLDEAVDTLGAVIDLGSGDDVITFNNHSYGYDGKVLLIGEGAVVDGGDAADTDVMNVNLVECTFVAEGSILNIDTINLTVLNAVDDQTSGLTGNAVNKGNSDATRVRAQIDVSNADDDLDTINLVSQEAPLLAVPATELYEAGSEARFTVNNYRPEVTVNLTAQETGETDEVDSNTDDGEYPGELFLTPEIANGLNEHFDVSLEVDLEDGSGADDTFTLNVTPASGEFDMQFAIADDIENLVLDFGDAGSHYVSMVSDKSSEYYDSIGFGNDDEDYTFTLTSAAVLGSAVGTAYTNMFGNNNEIIHVSDVSAGTITVDVAADVRLSLDGDMNAAYDQTDLSAGYSLDDGLHLNTYSILTGTGDDWVDVTTDNVDGDDTIDLGAGRNELVIANDIVVDDVLNSDEIFENIFNVQILTLAGDTWEDTAHKNDGTFGTNGEIDIALMDDALATGIDTIQLVSLDGNDAEVNLLIDSEFTRDLTINIDSRYSGAELWVDNVAGVALDVNVAVASVGVENDLDIQTLIHFDQADMPLPSADAIAGDYVTGQVDLAFELLDAGTNYIGDDSFGYGATVDLYVANSDFAQINEITIDSDAVHVTNGDNVLDDYLVEVMVSDDWNDAGTLVIDASGVAPGADADDQVDLGFFHHAGVSGMYLDASYGEDYEDDAVLDVTGTVNDDWITLWGKTDEGDIVDAGAGDDIIEGGIGNDTLAGGAGSDAFIFEYTGASNNLDSITDFAAGNGNDILDFTDFFEGTEAYFVNNGSSYGVTFDMYAADDAIADVPNDALYVATSSIDNIDATGMIIGVDNANSSATQADIAGMFQTSINIGDNYLALDDLAKCVVIFGDHNSAGQQVQVFMVDDNIDGVSGNVDSNEVFLVGTVKAQDLDSFVAFNFGLMVA